MDFIFLIECSEDVKNIGFLYQNIEKPLKKALSNNGYHLKEYWFNLRIFSEKFQNFFNNECKINKKSKSFVYTYELDSTFFNQLSEEDALKLVCFELNLSLEKYNEIKPKTYNKQDDFVIDVQKIIKKWL